MDLAFSASDEAFRVEVREYLEELLTGEFSALRGLGGSGSEHEAFDERLVWERRLAADGWICLGWPVEHGGRDLPLTQQVIFYEEYARADAPARVGLIGEGLLGPTIMAFGTDDQRARFLPKIRAAEELWCQGYSEPDAGSDLANVKTTAEMDPSSGRAGEWVVTGQKVWTSLATWSDWCFVVCRTDRDAPKHKGISYLLVPMRQAGVEIRPIVQITGTSEFNEVFFDGARTDASNIVGEPNDGWRVAMGTLAFERGTFTFGQQIGFERELRLVTDLAVRTGASRDPVVRQRLADAWVGLKVMRFNAMRVLSTLAKGVEPGPEASVTKLVWSEWHRRLGEIAMDVQGANSMLDGAPLQAMFLFSRSDTIYAGSSEIQRNLVGERALGLPREPSPS
ncbi:MAG TPA: acyl-CoA dehydrogenase family protein [Acidimicrobiia bacterium]|nr:acyl-CoA dehydrogenase family protein [Acidimicrobiia bacterium]